MERAPKRGQPRANGIVDPIEFRADPPCSRDEELGRGTRARGACAERHGVLAEGPFKRNEAAQAPRAAVDERDVVISLTDSQDKLHCTLMSKSATSCNF